MHYKNGREAKNGDRVILLPNGYRKVAIAGILYDATAGNNDCNGKIAITTAQDPMPDLKEVLHADDVAAANIPDSTSRNMTTVLILLALMLSMLSASAQSGVATATSTVIDFFNLGGTNGIAQAYQFDVGVGYGYATDGEKSLGMAQLGYWLTPQQGMSLDYDESYKQHGFWDVGYETRTVFGNTNNVLTLETAVKVGAIQSTDDPLGSVRVALEPSLRIKLWKNVGLKFLCKIIADQKPEPFLIINYRFQ